MIILKILLWILRIILIVLAVLAVAFAVPVGVCFTFDEKPKLAVKYLFIKIPIDLEPNEEKQRKKVLKEEKKKQKELLKSQKKKVRNTLNKSGKNTPAKKTKTQDIKKTDTKNKKENKPDTKMKPEKQNNPEEEKKPKKKNKTLERIKSLWEERGLEGITELIKEIAKIAGGLLSCVFKHILFKKLDLFITVAFEDAADTATKYGYACAGIYPAMAIILRVFKYKDYNVIIVPDFDKQAPEIYTDLEISIVPWFVVAGGIEAIIKLLKLKAKKMI